MQYSKTPKVTAMTADLCMKITNGVTLEGCILCESTPIEGTDLRLVLRMWSDAIADRVTGFSTVLEGNLALLPDPIDPTEHESESLEGAKTDFALRISALHAAGYMVEFF